MKQDIKLNLVQRAILINQNLILNILQAEQHEDDTDTKADIDDVISILENDFKDHYDEVLPDQIGGHIATLFKAKYRHL